MLTNEALNRTVDGESQIMASLLQITVAAPPSHLR